MRRKKFTSPLGSWINFFVVIKIFYFFSLLFFSKFFPKRLSPFYFRPVENDDNEIVVTLDENLRFCRFFFWCGVRFLKKSVLVFRGCCLCTAVKVTLLTEVTVLAPSMMRNSSRQGQGGMWIALFYLVGRYFRLQCK